MMQELERCCFETLEPRQLLAWYDTDARALQIRHAGWRL